MRLWQVGQQLLGSLVASPEHLDLGGDMRADIVVEEQSVDKRNVGAREGPIPLQIVPNLRPSSHHPRSLDIDLPVRLDSEVSPLVDRLMQSGHAFHRLDRGETSLDVLGSVRSAR